MQIELTVKALEFVNGLHGAVPEQYRDTDNHLNQLHLK
jgi:hypothetical protein